MKEFKVFLLKGVSEKSKKEYVKLYIDFGYSELSISFDIGVISQYCDLRPSDIASLKINEKKHIADFKLKGV